ncbi:MAG: 2-oxoacid:acceptor oxidoreductase subunit alpha [Saprospirales bacterium]|nr:2-oxoacid:acceptor oxidoreductase subunit alpha [Saprospirales bacterium]
MSAKELKGAVIKFAGDSGDGMQLAGSLFTSTTAFIGNQIATFPDFPSEIRAPTGTVAGVSGFQIHFGSTGVHSPGDTPDVLVAMNPAALKANMGDLKPAATIIVDIDTFDRKNFDKAGLEADPLTDGSLDDFQVIKAPVTSMTKTSLADMGLSNKEMMQCKNMFVLGMVYWLFSEPMEPTIQFFERKFKVNPVVVEANKKVLLAGYNFAETVEAFTSSFTVPPAKKAPGMYRNITGNQATAWGFLAAAQKAGRGLFLGSYPITPATDILQELARHKWTGIKIFQAEDEIAGICSAIGASFAGDLAITTTSGPGMALKTEAIGLAVMTELPLVVVDVQRGGPSTGLPTKTEQADLMQAVYGRNGESPVVVLAASTPADCFDWAFEASRIAIEHMTPVILLSENYIANGSEQWKIQTLEELPEIHPPLPVSREEWSPYKRQAETLVRTWVTPGTAGFEHRIGGLEKEDGSGNVSYTPANHHHMVKTRADKVAKVADDIPLQRYLGKDANKLLVVGWGGQFGILVAAVKEMQEEGQSVGLVNFNYIHPLPKNTEEIFGKFEKIVVCELNNGQFVKHLRAQLPQFSYEPFNKIAGQPFRVAELKRKFYEIIERK